MKAELFYITDTYCIWCFGFGQVVDRLLQHYSKRVRVRVVSGGMIPSDIPLSDIFGRFPDPIALHKRVASISGQAFGNLYLDEIRQFRNSKRILNSTLPARALLAFRQLGVKKDLTIASAIQCAYYLEGRDLQDVTTYKRIAARFRIGFADFKAKMDGPELTEALLDERRMVEQLDVQIFPTMLLRSSDGRFVTIARGFLPFADLKANLDTALSRYWSVSALETEEQACSLDNNER